MGQRATTHEIRQQLSYQQGYDIFVLNNHRNYARWLPPARTHLLLEWKGVIECLAGVAVAECGGLSLPELPRISATEGHNCGEGRTHLVGSLNIFEFGAPDIILSAVCYSNVDKTC